MRKYIFLIILFGLLACKNEPGKTGKKSVAKKLSYKERVEFWKDSIPDNSIVSNDIEFINDSILKGKFKLDISK
jgi:hypothetical protein